MTRLPCKHICHRSRIAPLQVANLFFSFQLLPGFRSFYCFWRFALFTDQPTDTFAAETKVHMQTRLE